MKLFPALTGVGILCCTSTIAFAQIKPVEEAVQAVNQVQHAVQSGVVVPSVVRNTPYLPVTIQMPEFSGLVRANAPRVSVNLYDVRLPLSATITPVNISLIEKTVKTKMKRLQPTLALEWIQKGGKALYQTQEELAQDLHVFYAGKGYRRLSPGGKEVLFYMLPVDGIIYQPLGRRPVALEAKRDFIIYYPAKKWGQLASNEPGVWRFFSENSQPMAEDGISADLIGQDVAVRFPNEVQAYQVEKTQMMLRANQARWAEMRDKGLNTERWKQMGGKMAYTSQQELGKDLAAFYGKDAPRFQDQFSKQIGFLYEIPVNGMLYTPEGYTLELNPAQQVIFVTEKLGGQIMDRPVFENPIFYRWVP